MPNGSPAQIKHIGSIKIEPIFFLKDVLHVPDFQFNLISISKLTRQIGSHVLFSQDCCLLQDYISQRVVVLGKEEKGLYCLDMGEHSPSDKFIMQ